jgi:CRP/FNR family transcriptional regulator, cyclic AMP receptor protein
LQDLTVDWALLAAVPEPQRRQLLSGASRHRFSRGEVLFHEGDPGDSLHLIVKGHLAARATTPLGDTATLRVFKPGESFGELAVVSPGPRNATVVALEAAETLALHVSHVDAMRAEYPNVDRVLVDALVAEVRRTSRALVEALYLPVEKRLWRRLLELAEMYGASPPIEIPLTQEDLAQLAGTTRPTANRMLRDAEQHGIVNTARGRIEVCDLETLRRKAR